MSDHKHIWIKEKQKGDNGYYRCSSCLFSCITDENTPKGSILLCILDKSNRVVQDYTSGCFACTGEWK